MTFRYNHRPRPRRRSRDRGDRRAWEHIEYEYEGRFAEDEDVFRPFLKKGGRARLFLALACVAALPLVAPGRSATEEESALLLTYFRDNGQHGVNLAMSSNGVDFVALNGDRPIFKPPPWPGQNLTRDASVLYRDGRFRMVWTSQWKGRIFGYADSPDLVHWSEPRQVRPFPETLPPEDQPDNIWAPEIHWDPLKQDYFILFASTTPRERNDDDASNNNGKAGSQYDNRMYITRTRDFVTFSDAKLFFDQGFASIDAVMRLDDAKQRWAMVIKCSRDETLEWMPGRNLWITFTGMDLDRPSFSSLQGPLAGNHSRMFSNPEPRKSMAEGPSLLRYGGRWLLLWDEPAGGGFQLATSPGLETWTHERTTRFPPRAYHGTLFMAPRSAVGWLGEPWTPRDYGTDGPAPLGSITRRPEPRPAESLLPGAEAWELAWSDEFDYPDAELDKAWQSQNGPSGHTLCSRWRENAVVTNGTLRLVNRKEKRGGQEWTSGNVWTRQAFQYGYFECRYRYAAAEGCNNSFWLMPAGKVPAGMKHFEIDINEGHYPNEVSSNIHNHSDRIEVNGRKTHPTSSRSFAFGVRPDVTLRLENPVTTRRIRFSTRHESAVHLGEFLILDATGRADHARDPATRITASGFVKAGSDTTKNLVDGRPDTRWVSQREGAKWVEFTFPADRTIGSIRFLNGYGTTNDWKALLNDYRVERHDGRTWVPMADFDVAEGAHNFAREFHVFGLDWTERELVFYLDGKELRRERNEFCHSPAQVWLSLAIIPWAGPITDAIDGTFMEVDYVRVYRMKPRG
jgi:hypothetical protein